MPDIKLTEGNDTYVHPKGAEWSHIYGLGGDDKLHSYRNAQLLGGRGNDTISSEFDDRWGGNAAYWDSPSAIFVDLAAGYALDGWGTRDTLIGIANISSPGRPGDMVYGDHRNNDLNINGFRQAGQAFFDGRDGYDTANVWDRTFQEFKLWVSADGRSFTLELNGYKAEVHNVESVEFRGPNRPNDRYAISDLIDINTVGEQTLIAANQHGWKSADFGPGKTLSYSFMLAAPGYAAAQGLSGFATSNAAYQKAVRDVMARLSGELNVRFVEADESIGQLGQLRFGTSQQAATKGVAYVPGVVTDDRAGDVFMDLESLTQLAPGQEGYQTLLHEIGHALGLSHPLTSPDGSARATLLPKWQDPAYTVMVNGPSLSGLWQSWFGLLDMQALKKMYGAPPASAGVENNTIALHDGHGQLVFTLADGGGNDTLDLSILSFGASIDLQPGYSSSVGQNTQGIASQNNMLIAPGTEIESVLGTAFDDVLKGNDKNNFFAPGRGNDIIDGRGGFNQAYWSETHSEFEVLMSEWSGDWMVNHLAGVNGSDSLRNIDRIHFSDRSVALDVQGKAGNVAKAMTLLLGRNALDDLALTGLVLHLMDANNYSLEQIMAVGIKHVLGDNPNRVQVIDLLYSGLFGKSPTAAETSSLVGLLDQYTPSKLAVLATELNEPNLVKTVLAGVNLQGLDFISFIP
jgi:serralysin